MIAAENLCLRQGERELIRDLNFRVAAGEVWLVLGENGCGKSTLLSALAGWLPPDEGRVVLGERAIQGVPPQQRALTMAWQVQHDVCPFPMSVIEKILTGRHPHLSRWAWEGETDVAIAQQQLARVDLAGLSARDLATLSGGERRRVALATALTQQAPLLLLDEPLSQLDLRHQQQALQVLREEQQQGRAVVMVTHDPNHAHLLATHALLLFGDGRWLAGRVDEVLTAETLSALDRYPVRALEDEGLTWFGST